MDILDECPNRVSLNPIWKVLYCLMCVLNVSLSTVSKVNPIFPGSMKPLNFPLSVSTVVYIPSVFFLLKYDINCYFDSLDYLRVSGFDY